MILSESSFIGEVLSVEPPFEGRNYLVPDKNRVVVLLDYIFYTNLVWKYGKFYDPHI